MLKRLYRASGGLCGRRLVGVGGLVGYLWNSLDLQI